MILYYSSGACSLVPHISLEEAGASFTPTRIVLAGFSQGCALTLMTGLRCAERLAGLVGLSGYLPLAAKAAARTRRFSAVICLGAVVRGDTPHFDYVAGECARGIAEVSREEVLPVIFGVLTTNTEQQALDRAGGTHGHAGTSAANAAAEMIHLLRTIQA